MRLLPLFCLVLLAKASNEIDHGGDEIVHPHDIAIHVHNRVKEKVLSKFGPKNNNGIDADEVDNEFSDNENTKALRKKGDRRNLDDRDGFAILCILFFAVIGSQIGLFWWKKKHYRSYQATTFVGLWVVPFIISVYFGFARFLFFNVAFTSLAAYTLYISTRNPLGKRTPRFVYRLFFGLYRLSWVIGVIGYVLIILDLFGVNRFATFAIYGPKGIPLDASEKAALEAAEAKTLEYPDGEGGVMHVRVKRGEHIKFLMFSPFGILLLYYGFYFGILSRDLAELITVRISTTLGYGAHEDVKKDKDGNIYEAVKTDRPAQRSDRWRVVPDNCCSLCDLSLREVEGKGELVPVEAPDDARKRVAQGQQLELTQLHHDPMADRSHIIAQYDPDIHGASEYYEQLIKEQRERQERFEEIQKQSANAAVVNVEEKLCRLECGHEFHEYCLRGWVIIGKRDTCPRCKVKVDLGKIVGLTPWESQSLLWGSLLDAMRYLVVWNPLIIAGVQVLIHALGLGNHRGEHTHG